MEVLAVRLVSQGNITAIADEELRKQVPIFTKHFLAAPFNPCSYMRIWVARRDNVVLGLTALNFGMWNGEIVLADIPVFRSIDEEATRALGERLNAFLADNGMTGRDAFLFLSDQESPESRCPKYEQFLSLWNAKPAERFAITVR